MSDGDSFAADISKHSRSDTLCCWPIWFGQTELPSQFISVGELSLWVGATKIFVDGAIYRPCRVGSTDCSVQMMDQFEVLC